MSKSSAKNNSSKISPITIQPKIEDNKDKHYYHHQSHSHSHSHSHQNGIKAIVKQPISIVKQKRKFGIKAGKPSVRFASSSKAKENDGTITEEPVKWMSRPNVILNSAIGLEYLNKLDYLLIKTTISSLVSQDHFVIKGENDSDEYRVPNKSTDWNCNLSYDFRNISGEKVYTAFEGANNDETSSLIRVVDAFNAEVMHIIRENKSCACCWCAGCCMNCSHHVTIQAPPGVPIGHVRQSSSCWKSYHDAYNSKGNLIAYIKGPGIMSSHNNMFAISMANNKNITGEYCFNADIEIKNSKKHANYAIKFPNNIDVETKAILIGGYFLIDSIFYENSILFKQYNQ